MSTLVRLAGSVVDMVGEFAGIAAQGPVEGFLLLVGAILVFLPSALFGYLALGAVVDLLRPGSARETHPPGR